MGSPLLVLNKEVVACRRCARLTEYREAIGREKRRAYMEWDYWAKPVPGFGDPDARVLILGLAPGAHGSNRTGRPFTGDQSGKFMYPILYKTGFASQPTAERVDDGLRLIDAYITAAVRCAPPDNKPLPEEFQNCRRYLEGEIDSLTRRRVTVALGKLAFDAYLGILRDRGIIRSRVAFPFGHNVLHDIPGAGILIASYHPSQQNTSTGKLTAEMLRQVFERARAIAGKP